jgi:hypothetical protein
MRKKVKKRIHQEDLRFLARFLSSPSSNSSPMVFFLFFFAWDLLFSQLRNVWDEGCNNLLIFMRNRFQTTSSRFQPNNCGPQFLHFLNSANQWANHIIAVRNFNNYGLQFLSRNNFHLISSCRFNSSCLKSHFSRWHPCLHSITCKTIRNTAVSRTRHKD